MRFKAQAHLRGFIRSLSLAGIIGAGGALVLGSVWSTLLGPLGRLGPFLLAHENIGWFIIFLSFVVLLVVYQASLISRRSSRSGNVGGGGGAGYTVKPHVTLVAVLALVLAPALLIIYLKIGPPGYKRAIQVFALFACLGGAIIFYLRYPDRLPSVADKVGFFTGVTLAPPTVLEWLLKD
jgi:hypothetical protein